MVRVGLVIVIFIGELCAWAAAQKTFPVHGINDPRDQFVALWGATVYVDYQTVIADATLLIRNGKVVDVGKQVRIPPEAIRIDARGKFIYPSFIDLLSDYGQPAVQKEPDTLPRPPQFHSGKRGAYYWNQAVRPEIRGADFFTLNTKQAEQLRSMGFGAVVTHQRNGIVRGTGALVLAGNDQENESMLAEEVAAYYSFNKGNSRQAYPTSLMGSIALLRQAFYDAEWYANGGNREQVNVSLDALSRIRKLPAILETNQALSVLRADRIGDEFGIRFIVKGGGDEYQQLVDLQQADVRVLVPLNFPLPVEFNDPYDAAMVSLADMMHWEFAPANARFLLQAGIPFALTAAGLQEPKTFWKNLRLAVEVGLPPKDALKALTYTPAQWIGMHDQIGSLAPGKWANFFISSDSIFLSHATILQHWVKGKPYAVEANDLVDLRGLYSVQLGPLQGTLRIEGSIQKPHATLQFGGDTVIKVHVQRTDQLISLRFSWPKDTLGTYLLSGYLAERNLKGWGTDRFGQPITWLANYQQPIDSKDTTRQWKHTIEGALRYPFVGYGNTALPTPQTILIKNATVWTGESEGILQNTDVWLHQGRIARIGKNLNMPAEIVVDGTGKHLTAGIIDEHAHISIAQGVNECSHSVTSEVRIGDVINPADINIYRQLAGGVTASHLLHGSCNSIGGQTQLIKLRWGYGAEQLKFEGWPGFIKFALGENVKTSNWGDMHRVRFPQTRMGVEQTIRDAFIRAKDYQTLWQEYRASLARKKTARPAPRRDLQLDALVEILEGQRHITCHSYVQSEINMLMHLADSLGFKVNTFTHILEGFKVADKLKAHGANASSFSDWWAYKFEVYDAIAHNPALLVQTGVTTAVNSDDAEMARRLNQEAAKSITYGGLSEQEAWNLCTLNPARMLRVDHRTGSIKVGKDADVVLWSANPLSIYAVAEMTIVDGAVFYRRDDVQAKQAWIEAERRRLINKMKAAAQAGQPTRKLEGYVARQWECETMTDGHDVE